MEAVKYLLLIMNMVTTTIKNVILLTILMKWLVLNLKVWIFSKTIQQRLYDN